MGKNAVIISQIGVLASEGCRKNKERKEQAKEIKQKSNHREQR